MDFDLARISGSDLDLLRKVVFSLTSTNDIGKDSLMLVGAHCRDLIQTAFGRKELLRGTDDVDLALGVANAREYSRAVEGLQRSGNTAIRFLVEDIPVDIVPFGEIEKPDGTSNVDERPGGIDVFAFREVFDKAAPINLAEGVQIRLPSPQGYTALKLKAWCDRSINYSDKDASDIVVACNWYRNDIALQDRIYEVEHQELVDSDYDPRRAAIRILGRDVVKEIGPERTAELSQVWSLTNLERLTQRMAQALGPNSKELAIQFVSDVTHYLT